MQRFELTQYSYHLNRDMHILVHGHSGLPILAFPTQDSLCNNYEDFGMIDNVADYIESGAIQFFTVDTIDRESWSDVFGDKGHRAYMQECYYQYIVEEAWPYISVRRMQQSLSSAVRIFSAACWDSPAAIMRLISGTAGATTFSTTIPRRLSWRICLRTIRILTFIIRERSSSVRDRGPGRNRDFPLYII